MIKFLVVLLCLGLFGCAMPFERSMKTALLEKAVKEFNFAKSDKTGILVLHCYPGSNDTAIDYGFLINFNDEKVLLAYKFSDTTITLDAGEYTVKFAEVDKYEKISSKIAERTLKISEGAKVFYEVTGGWLSYATEPAIKKVDK